MWKHLTAACSSFLFFRQFNGNYFLLLDSLLYRLFPLCIFLPLHFKRNLFTSTYWHLMAGKPSKVQVSEWPHYLILASFCFHIWGWKKKDKWIKDSAPFSMDHHDLESSIFPFVSNTPTLQKKKKKIDCFTDFACFFLSETLDYVYLFVTFFATFKSTVLTLWITFLQ